MALRYLWNLRRASVCRNVIPTSGIHVGTDETQPGKVPLTEEEKKLLENLGEPDSETLGYLNELYVGFGVTAEERHKQKEEKRNIQEKNQSHKPIKTLSSSPIGTRRDFCRMFHASAVASSDAEDIVPSLKGRRKAFEDESRIIWDSQETVMDYYPEGQKVSRETEEGIVIQHGETGVFDAEDLVNLLRQEKLQDIAVIQVPPNLPYADYLVIGTTLSRRQGIAITAFLKKMYKVTKRSGDHQLKIEGEDCDEWKVLDFGNIVLHLFDGPTREKYDIETLWTVGRDFDEPTQGFSEENEVLDVLSQHMAFVRSLSATPTSPS